jgi:alpha-1,3-rhamnosyl/mannosyltransferase
VRHLGYIESEARRDVYAGAAALVIPSLYEGFGLTALEAMTVGVPVIAANRGSLPEVVGDAGLLVDPGDPEAIAAALHAVLTDSGRAMALSEAGRRRSTQFSWSTSAAALRASYRQAIARKKGAAR